MTSTFASPNAQLFRALADRFSDPTEMRDVVANGCYGGVSGFIYYDELNAFFYEHEEAIEELLDELDISPAQLVKYPSNWTFDEIRQNAVWIIVEHYCQCQTD